MAKTPLEPGDFKKVGHFEAKFQVEGLYVSLQYLRALRYGNGYITTMTLEVFIQSNFVTDFIRLKLNFI